MDKLLTTIYEFTVNMDLALQQENYHEFENLVNKRNTMMINVDAFKAAHPHYMYTREEKQLLEETLCLEQSFTSLLKENINETKNSLNQLEKKKQVSKKYRPYIKQTNGVFIDSKK
jgi:hypothetical protein